MGKKKDYQKVVEVEISDREERINSHYLADGVTTISHQIAPASIIYSSDNDLKIEDNYVRTFVINGYPSRVSLGWLDKMYSYDGDMDVCCYIEPSNERTALDELTSKITQYQTQLDIETERGSVKNTTALRSKLEALYRQRALLEQNYENMFHTSTFCSLYNHDVKELNKSAQKFQSKISGGRMKIMPLALRQDDGYKTVSPFGICEIPDYFRNINTGALSTMFPFYNSELNHPNGTFIGINRLRQTPVIIDFFNRRVLGNANVFISGASGAGKTFFTSLFILRSGLEGIRTLIIDPENEYGACTQALNGISIKIGQNSTNMINPFDIDWEIEIDDNGEPTGRKFVDIKSKISELLNLIYVMCPQNFTDDIKSDVSEVLMNLYEEIGINERTESLYEDYQHFDEVTGEYINSKILKKMPCMSDFYNKLYSYAEQRNDNELLKVAKSLKIYTKGNIYDLFDCHSTINISDFDEAPIIRFDISGIEDNVLRPIGMHIVNTWATNKFVKRNLNQKKRLVVDEAWLMLQQNIKGSETTALFLENSARRIRKYNGSLCCVSQNFREFVSRPEGLAILSNSAVKLFLKQTPEDINAVGDRFLMSDGEKSFLLRASRGDVLLKVANESFVIDVFAFPFEEEIITKKFLKDSYYK